MMMMKIRKRGTFFLAAPFCGNFDCHPFPLFADVEGKPRPARCKRADKRHPSGPPARAQLRWTNMAGTEQRENVYVFIPNLIGSVHPCDRAQLWRRASVSRLARTAALSSVLLPVNPIE